MKTEQSSVSSSITLQIFPSATFYVIWWLMYAMDSSFTQKDRCLHGGLVPTWLKELVVVVSSQTSFQTTWMGGGGGRNNADISSS